MPYSQNQEEQIILQYFGGYVGTALGLGENSGELYSNCLALIEKGWNACLVEPSPKAFPMLKELHKDRENVFCYEVAVGDKNGRLDFWESGEHVGNGDVALLSTLKASEMNRWKGTTDFTKITVEAVDFKNLMRRVPYSIFEFISCDCEGFDLDIIKQINFDELGTRVLCVEWNGIDLESYAEVMHPWGFNMIHSNAENIIWAI